MSPAFKAIRTAVVTVASVGLLSCGPNPPSPPSGKEVFPTPSAKTLPEEVPAPKLGGKILMMHYMPWYKTPEVRGEWSNHWTGNESQHHPQQTGADGLPDIWSHYHPLIGLYDSADPDVLECHLLQMKLAGVNGVLADWYGIGKTDDYAEIHDATRQLFAATGRFGMNFAACFEDRTIEVMINRKKLQPEKVADYLTQNLQWMQTEWFTKPHYLQFHNRPLLLDFGPLYVLDPAIWSVAFASLSVRPAFYCLHHLWKKAGADGGFTWVHHDPWEGTPTPETIRQRIREVFNYVSKDPEQVIVSAYPGFKDVYEKHLEGLDHRNGKTLQETLEAGIEGPWPIIQLVTWNDYGEGTMIEPTHEFGYTFLEIIQQSRRKELGDSFSFTTNDLRLPARLYVLRKKHNVPAEALNRISQLLNKGACEEARLELDRQEGSQAAGSQR